MIDTDASDGGRYGNVDGGASTTSLQRVTPSKKALQSVLSAIDSYQVEPREPSVLGCLVSAVVLPLTITYCVCLYTSMRAAPLIESNSVVWSSSANPFPLNFTCDSLEGCYYSFGNHSTCFHLPSKDSVLVDVEYASDRRPTLSIFGAPDDLYHGSIASVLSRPSHWEKRDEHKNGVMDMLQPMQGGFELAHYVRVNNLTLAGEVGEWRDEWFVSYIPSDPGREAFQGEPCGAAYPVVLGMAHARLKMAPSFHFISVEESFSWWAYIGTASGMHGLLLTFGAVILSIIEVDLFMRACASRRSAEMTAPKTDSVVSLKSSPEV